MRVLTFNLHHGRGLDGRVDLGRVAGVIARSDADVVGLQEVDRHWSARSGFDDQAGVLAGLLGMHAVHGPTLDGDPPAPGRPRREYGNAILSRSPATDSSNTLLPPGAGERRGLLRARTVLDGTPLDVYATHLDYRFAADRLAQARLVADALAGATPCVLLADLNAPPDTPEVRLLANSLVDVWAAVGRGGGSTHGVLRRRRIDYVFCSGDLRPVTSRVRWTVASDHRPVQAVLAR